MAAVLHGRLADSPQQDAPVSWTARTPESAGQTARATAEALDSRAAALGERQLTEPEPWVMRHLNVIVPSVEELMSWQNSCC